MRTAFGQIVTVSEIGLSNEKSVHELYQLSENESITEGAGDKRKRLFIGIDIQYDFMETGALPVPNSHKDVENTTRFIFNHINKISKIAVSLDTHRLNQIFHPSWWVDNEGRHPAPLTVITSQEVREQKWKAVYHPIESLSYLNLLEENSNKNLCIWPYHCIEGTRGASLEGQFSNMIHFHSFVRKTDIIKIVKGKNPLSEMYGIFKQEDGKVENDDFLQGIQEYDEIIIAGQAKSHCVFESIRQLVEHYCTDRDVTGKIVVLEDCMSSIPGFEEETAKSLQHFSETYGIQLVKSTEYQMK
ncbi:hypothetical protein [Bacillus alkalicellulosilyticus]|uniref:hypothetical protein n=1 Tax=Alkalihalobacterium alkalicellulosilyticum TaxID=1912214 RepID=UPI000997C4D4|nr:hypothetical protein [Bacillus alkalicellulosilyticus]